MPKAALITRGSRGIGAACARLFARQGYGAGIVCRKAKDQAESPGKRTPRPPWACRSEVYVCDVAQRGRCRL
ncbi:MAG: hypothetical protein ACLUNZ_10260 [Evtepia sp.]